MAAIDIITRYFPQLTPEQIEATRKEVVARVKDAPLFSYGWMGDSEN